MAALLQKFQGSVVGGVIGDCVGAVYEGAWGSFIGLDKVLKLVRKIESARDNDSEEESPNKKSKKKQMYYFTDDTAMARSVARSLIANKELNARDMARRFTEEYFKEPDRGYGAGVVTVFRLLSECDCLDTFGPAKKQFDGRGSYGNGGAMRISPAALFVNRKSYNFSKLKEIAETITRITHSHYQAIQGAILQCYAVELALRTEKLDTDQFIDDLIDKMKPMEEESAKEHTDSIKDKVEKGKGDCDTKECLIGPLTVELAALEHLKYPYRFTMSLSDTKYDKTTMPYCWKLEKIREFVHQETLPTTDEINENLGTDISALGSVPTAIYSFLQSPKPLDRLQDRSGYERTIIYSISLGGDTDTIATMGGAIAGAYYGLDAIQPYFLEACEGVDDALQFANELYNLT